MPGQADYVTKGECLQHVTKIENQLTVIQKAICGDDLRGGLVHDVNKLATEVVLLKDTVSKKGIKHKESRKMLGAIAASVITALASILVAVFK